MTRRVHRVHGYRHAPPRSASIKLPVVLSVAGSLLGLSLLHVTGHPVVLSTPRAVAAAQPASLPALPPVVDQGYAPPAGPFPDTPPPVQHPHPVTRALRASHGTITPPLPRIQANPEGWIDHIPSVTQEQVARALADYASPLAGTWPRKGGYSYAEYIWHAGKALGVDPAVFMGVFWHESHFGLRGVAAGTHSPGNLRCYSDPLPGSYCYPGDYEAYSSWWYGIDATYTLLRSYAHHGARTVAEAIPIWAPPSDSNNDPAYIQSVLATMAQITTL